MTSFNGKWKLVSAENLGPYLDAVGVTGDTKEKGLKNLSADNDVTQEITVDDTKVKIVTITPAGNFESSMVFGKEQDQPFYDGRMTKVVCTLDGNKLVENLSGPFTGCNTRTVDGDSMTMTLTSGSATATRKYKKL